MDRTVVPEIDFPAFPELEGEVRNADGTVTVPGDWLVRIGKYALEIEGAETEYKRIRGLYGAAASGAE